MADTFNAYHKWLGIPPKDQPPNHYRLLGVELFEADPDVISAAADQRMVYLRSFQHGKHAAAAETLLNEISAARVCLLTPERREAYDGALRSKQATLPQPRPMTPGTVAREQTLAQARAGKSTPPPIPRDTAPLRTIDTQEVALAPAPLPGKPAAPPPRTPGPLPMAAYAPSTPAAPVAPKGPPPLPVAVPRAASPKAKGPAIGARVGQFVARLPQRIGAALLFLLRLPGVILIWMVRSADAALLKLVGEENRILHTFLRVVTCGLLAIAMVAGGWFGGHWAVAALRERVARVEQPKAPAHVSVAHIFVMPAALGEPPGEDPPIVTMPDPRPTISPPIPQPTVEPGNEPVRSARPTALKDAPTYTVAQLQREIAAAQRVESLLDIVLDPELQTVDRHQRTFEYRQAMGSLAHTYTFTPEVADSERNAVAAIVARANRTLAKQNFFVTRTVNDCKLPGPDAPGAIFCGKIKSKLFFGGLYRWEIDLPTQPVTTMLGLSEADLGASFAPGKEVLVVGAIIDQPAPRIAGYDGSSTVAIWLGDLFAGPPNSTEIARVPREEIRLPPTTPAEPAIDEPAIDEPVDRSADLVALALFATTLNNAGQPLEVPNSHPLLTRWLATGLVQRARKRSWGCEQAEGPPDTKVFGDQGTAWASATRDDQVEWLELHYSETVTPKEVHVFETYCPGALFAVTGFRGEREVDLWRGVDPTSSAARGGTSVVRIAHPLATNRLRIYLNSPAVAGWNEIDAVGIVDHRDKTHWAAVAIASSNYAGESTPPFSIDGKRLVELFAASPALTKQLRLQLERQR